MRRSSLRSAAGSMEFRLPLNSQPAAPALSGFEELGELLDNRFSLLWRGRRTALPRHQTLNAMLDWSYNLLSQHEKAVLGRLSVFVGDFTLEAACSVAADAEIDQASSTRAITSLLAKSLISKTESRGSTYYRLLETTRIFAASEACRARRSESRCPAACEVFLRVSPARPARSIEVWRARSFEIRRTYRQRAGGAPMGVL